jgi:hypothetical protein
MRTQDQRPPRLLVEVEFANEVAEHRRVLPHSGPGVGAPVRRRVEPLSVDVQFGPRMIALINPVT